MITFVITLLRLSLWWLVLIWIIVIGVARSIRIVFPTHRLWWISVCWNILLNCGRVWLFGRELFGKIVDDALIFFKTSKQFLQTWDHVIRVLATSYSSWFLALLALSSFFWHLKNIQFVSFASKCLRRVKGSKIHALPLFSFFLWSWLL